MLLGVGGGAAQGTVCPSPEDMVQLDSGTVDQQLTCDKPPQHVQAHAVRGTFFPEDQVERGRGGKVETEMEVLRVL